jgi:uncharacterized protein
MSAADAQAEPTMEEILASIRKIISEDDAPASAPDDDVLDLADAEPVIDLPEPVAETVSADFDFDALDIGDDEPAPAPADDFDMDDLVIEERAPEPVYAPEPAPVMARPEPAQPVYQPAPAPMEAIDRLVGDQVAAQASSVFSRLNTGLPGMFVSGNTVEGLVAELLKPMLREWLDNNLNRIVEEKVEAEVARLARRGF